MFSMSAEHNNARLISRALRAGLKVFLTSIATPEQEDAIEVLSVENDGRLCFTDADGIRQTNRAVLKNGIDPETDRYFISDKQRSALSEYANLADLAIDLHLLEKHMHLFGNVDYQPDFENGDWINLRGEGNELRENGGPTKAMLVRVHKVFFDDHDGVWKYIGYTNADSEISLVEGECWRMEKFDVEKLREVPLWFKD